MLHSNQVAISSREPSTTTKFSKPAKLLICVWVLFLALSLLIRAGKFLVPIFPLGSIGLGLFLYFRVPTLYVGYTWWYCFLTPLVRRIIDVQSGYVTPGRWSAVSMLVASISFISLFRALPTAYRRGGLAFVLSAVAVIYAFAIGLVLGKHDLQYIITLFEWLGPVAFGFHLFLSWQEYPQLRDVTQRTFIWGTLLMGIYGIVQFTTAPEWDSFYLNNIDANSFGQPYPFEIRVFGTLNSPQNFAMVMMAGLLLLLGGRGIALLPAAGTGFLSFLLSMSRSGWLGFAAGVPTFFPFLKPKFQLRFVLTLLFIAMLVVPLANMEPFAEPISQRLESFSSGSEDFSVQERTEGYNLLLGLALRQLIGEGLGSSGPGTVLGGADSALFPLMFSFGWIGAILYVSGMVLILGQLFQSKDQGKDVFSSATKAIVVGALAQAGFNLIFVDSFGMILWGFLGTGLAAQKYYLHQSADVWINHDQGRSQT